MVGEVQLRLEETFGPFLVTDEEERKKENKCLNLYRTLILFRSDNLLIKNQCHFQHNYLNWTIEFMCLTEQHVST
jgi:hypothetical protein